MPTPSELAKKVSERCSLIAKQLDQIASERHGAAVTLGGVTKGRSISEIIAFAAAMSELGRPVVVAESYLKELASKQQELNLIENLELHFIGPIQSNKVASLVGLVSVIQSVSSLKLLRMIQARALQLGIKQRLFLQCNISGDEAKQGFVPELVCEAVNEALECSNIDLVGLMTITRFYDNSEDVRPDYRRMFKLYKEVLEAFPLLNEKGFELSMGMSADYDIAAQEGATMVRIGSLLFE
jgi:PLP dependent protein